MPAVGARTVASRCAFSSVAICASTPASRARAASISSRRAPDFSLATASAAARTRSSPARMRSFATSLLVAASSRGFCAPELEASSVFEAFQVALGRGELLAGAGDVGLGGGPLGFGLTDVFLARAGEEQAELSVGAEPVGRCALQGQGDVGRVELGDDVAGVDSIALGHLEVDESASHFGRHPHLRGLDVPRHADAIGRRLLAAGGKGEQGGDEGGGDGARMVQGHERSPVGPASGAAGMTACRLSIWRCAMKRSGSSRPTSNWATRARALRMGVVAR